MVQHITIFTVADQYKVAYGLSNRAIFNDLEQPLPVTWLSSLRHFFDTEYLTNCYRYGHSYYERQIGNHTQAF